MNIKRAATGFATACSSAGLLTVSTAIAQDESIATEALAIAVRPAIARVVGACEGTYRLPDTGQVLSGRVSTGVVGTGAVISGNGYVLTSDRVLDAARSGDAASRERALVLQKESSCEPQLRTSVAEELTRAFALVSGADSGKLATDVDYVRSQLQIQAFAIVQAILLADGRELDFQRVPLSSGENDAGTFALLKIDATDVSAIALAETLPAAETAIARVGYPATADDASTPLNPAQVPAAAAASAPAWSETTAIALPESDRFLGSPFFDEQGQLVALQVNYEDNGRAAIASVPAIRTLLQDAGIALQPTLDIELTDSPVPVAVESEPSWWQRMAAGGAVGVAVLGGLLGAGIVWWKRRSPSHPNANSPQSTRPASDPYSSTLPPNLLPELNGADGNATRFMPRPISLGSIGFITGELAGQQFAIPPQGLSVGRDGTVAQVVVDRPGISRKHVWIGLRGNRVMLEDFDSVNGTFLNDPRSQRIRGEVPLNPGDTVILADDAVQFRYFEEAVTPDETILAIGPKSDYGVLTCIQCIDPEMVGRQFRIPPEGLTIGRDAAQAHVAIDSRELSKQHVWVGPLGDYIYAVDNGSLNGTYLNQLGTQSIKEEKLTPGDTIVVSNSNVAQFRYSPPRTEADLHSEEETWFPDL